MCTGSRPFAWAVFRRSPLAGIGAAMCTQDCGVHIWAPLARSSFFTTSYVPQVMAGWVVEQRLHVLGSYVATFAHRNSVAGLFAHQVSDSIQVRLNGLELTQSPDEALPCRNSASGAAARPICHRTSAGYLKASGATSGIAVLSLGVRLKSISLSEDHTDEFLGVLVFFQHQFSPGFEVFGIAVGAITTSTALVILIVDHLRTGAFTSMVVFELVWSSILGVLWFVEGVLGAHLTVLNFDNFSCDLFAASLQEVCNETQAIMGVAFGVWIVLHVYAIALLVFALRNKSRGAPIWTSSLKQHASQLSQSHSATQGFMSLVMTQSEPDSGLRARAEP
ncbi:hypothetical protein VTO73DRAFT_13734 [Trametes versicolor]